MVSVSTLNDDFYIFDEKNYCLVGRHSHRIFQLGDVVKVEILRANLEKKQLDFQLVDDKIKAQKTQFFRPENKKKKRRL
jgi:ribonuclease R